MSTAILHCSATFSLCFVLYIKNIISYLLSVLYFSNKKKFLLEILVLSLFFFLSALLNEKNEASYFSHIGLETHIQATRYFSISIFLPIPRFPFLIKQWHFPCQKAKASMRTNLAKL